MLARRVKQGATDRADLDAGSCAAPLGSRGAGIFFWNQAGFCGTSPFALELHGLYGESGHERYRTPIADGTAYWRTFGGLSLGDGIRFNNPYRLSTPLGKTPESLSLTSAYYDIGLGAVRGPLDGLAHGAIVHLSIAAQGIPQEVLSLSYIALDQIGNGRASIFGRAGIPIILQPDVSGGVEAALGAAFMLSAGLGVQGELVGSLYYGAATFNHSVSTIPMLSGQLGLFVDYELLP